MVKKDNLVLLFEYNESQYCCGVADVGNFEVVDKSQLDDYEDQHKNSNMEKSVGADYNMALATLADYQFGILEPFLLKEGFTLVGESTNKNTKRKIRIYVWFKEL